MLLQDFVRRKHKHIPIEVETRTLDEVKEVLQFLQTDKHSLVKRLMLDNMTRLDPSAPGILFVTLADCRNMLRCGHGAMLGLWACCQAHHCLHPCPLGDVSVFSRSGQSQRPESLL